MEPAAAPSEPAAAPAEGDDGKAAFTGAGLLLVKVPASAKIFVNGKETETAGTERHYISRGLIRGASYNFEVKAELEQDGKPVTVTKFARLTAGGNAEVSFDELGNSEDAVVTAEPTTTKLVVRVPADAKVYLGGNETRQEGEVREFSTTKLREGDGWAEYTVRAELDVDGKVFEQEKVVSIKAGQTQEVSFDFADTTDDMPVASTARK